jgi:PAS domain-containing protein
MNRQDSEKTKEQLIAELEALREVRKQLEIRIEESTAELSNANELLKKEISDHQQTQEELFISDVTLQQMPDAILLIDLQGNILKWMGKAEQIFGYTTAEVIGKPVNFLHRPDIRETMTAEMIHSIQETGEFCGDAKPMAQLLGHIAD